MIKTVLIGGRGVLGRNLAAHLGQRNDCDTTILDQEDSLADLEGPLSAADVVFHLAGVYRSKDLKDFERWNAGFTRKICELLRQAGRAPKIVFESSIQADLDNPYGISKLAAETALRAFAVATGAPVRIYRLKGLFGKWCPPNHNSVTATFCYNIANDLPIVVSSPANEVELNYVDDVMAAFLAELKGTDVPEVPAVRIRLDDLAGRIQAFHEMPVTLTAPDFADSFNRALYATYSSYVPPAARRHNLTISADVRGSLAEFIKSPHFGQVFVSRTRPGVTRGNHYHHTKTEKFFVVEGAGVIRMRAIDGKDVHEYAVKGREYQVIDIPPGFTHSITNSGEGEMVTLFWASEIFDPNRPDTYYLPVDEAPAELGTAANQGLRY